MKGLVKFFDKLEDKVRAHLSKYPVIYSLIGGVGIVLFWRGVWHTADQFPFLTGPVSIIVSILILLATGLFVSFFIGDGIIISGLKRDKKFIEKTDADLKAEKETLVEIKDELHKIEDKLEEMDKRVIQSPTDRG